MSAPVPIAQQIEAVLDVAGPSSTALNAVVRTLRLFERFEPEARAFFAACIQADTEKRELAKHPAVAAVLDAFPGATISNVRETARG